MSSVLLLRPYASTKTPNSKNKILKMNVWGYQVIYCPRGKNTTCDIFSFWPWKQSRYSSFCGDVVTWMMEMGKLWEDAAKTADASVTSFLSKNSAQRIYGGVSRLIEVWIQRKWNTGELHPPVCLWSISVKQTYLLHKRSQWEMMYLPAHTASSQSRRICWCQ